jgi:ribosomal-protein-alanine N-acetyltransferase
MIVLALETATRAGSLAILEDGRVQTVRGDPWRTHGERLPQQMLSLVAAAGRTLQAIDLYAVVIGPGSFTGLRVGVAAIQGLALPGGKRVVAVPTLEAVAVGWRAENHRYADAAVVTCLDGQRGQIFHAAWHVRDGQPVSDASALWPATASEPADLARAVRSLPADLTKVIVCAGPRPHVAAVLPDVEICDLATPLAAVAARIAADRPDTAVAPHALRPLYVRRPDAEIARTRAEAARRASPEGRVGRDSRPADVVVERAALGDLEAVAGLQSRTFTNPWAADALRWELENTDVARLYVAHASSGAVIGYCACWLVFDELHVNSLAVESEWRRHGVARRLWQRAAADARAEGARSATLEVRRSNEAARALYEALGFRVEGVRHNYYQNPREDALILWNRHLAAAPG